MTRPATTTPLVPDQKDWHDIRCIILTNGHEYWIEPNSYHYHDAGVVTCIEDQATAITVIRADHITGYRYYTIGAPDAD